MASKTKRVAKTREALVQLFSNYLGLARGIHDIKEEDDIDGLEDAIDSVLESLLEGESDV